MQTSKMTTRGCADKVARPALFAWPLLSVLTFAIAASTPTVVSANPDGITTRDGPWLREEEFDADSSLHAREGQMVLLQLEQGSKRGGASRGAPGTNTVRLLVEEEATFNFCIPVDEPHLTQLKLREGRTDQPGKGNGGGRTVLQVRPGEDCGSVRLASGSYVVESRHDYRNVPPAKVAFLRLPDATKMEGDPLTASTARLALLAWKAPDGRYVKASSSGDGDLLADGTSVDEYTVFQISGPPSGFRMNDGAGNPVRTFSIPQPVKAETCDPELYTGSRSKTNTNCAQQQPEFIFSKKSNHSTFQLTGLNIIDRGNFSAPYYVESSPPTINNRTSFLSGDTFTADFRGISCDTTCDASALNLQQGEVALFTEEDYKGIAFVFTAEVSNLSIYDVAAAKGLAVGDGQAKSLRVGPDTVVLLYDAAGFAGTELPATGQVPNLADTPAGAISLSSFKLEEARNYILASDGCQSCDLEDIDLSALDLAKTDFTDTNLTGANLAGTTLSNATLDDAIIERAGLNNTDLRATSLHCTSFAFSDLTAALFDSTPDITRDFSCRLDLTNATLDYTTFAPANWRYFDLSNSTANNVPDTVSSLSSPLDLSGIILTGVQWLAGKTLDGANLGCFAGVGTTQAQCPGSTPTRKCSTLQGTVLSGASLKYACLAQASMEGAFLSFSNLDGADMSGVHLQAQLGRKVGTLEGAFMRNVNLSEANLTGVTADNVNFYTAAGGEADATNLTAPGANFSGAYLAFADFSGQLSSLQSTIWKDAMLLGANFSQANLSTNTSGGVNTGTNTTFEGAYLQGASFDTAILDDVNFLNTYWDALGAGGSLNLLIPQQNLEFSGYWKDLALPECPQALMWTGGNPPPMGVTTTDNTCPNALPGPCDTVWDQPKIDISLALFQSALPPAYPQAPNVSAENQCSGSFGDPNPYDLCWTITSQPPPPQCVMNQ